MEEKMDEIKIKAYAKINLGLDVVGRRTDGYHLVKMIMQSVDLYDVLKMKRLEEDRIVLTTDMEGLECDDRNLVYKAAALLKETCHIRQGVQIRLEKHIPMAAGLAGGSSDCAATLRGMAELFQLRLTEQQLRELGVKLGADVPYCLMGGTALSEGIGEILKPLRDMPECGILLAKPAVAVSTGHVYQALDALSDYAHPDIDGMQEAIDAGELTGIAERLGNVLEYVTVDEHEEIVRIKDAMMRLGALNTLMSGSGPTVFGIFETYEEAANVKVALADHPLIRDLFAVKPVRNQVTE